jgi:hypothetical protein
LTVDQKNLIGYTLFVVGSLLLVLCSLLLVLYSLLLVIISGKPTTNNNREQGTGNKMLMKEVNYDANERGEL